MARTKSRADHLELLRIEIEGYLNLVRIHRELEARAVQLLEEEGVYGMTLAQATALLILVQERAPSRPRGRASRSDPCPLARRRSLVDS